MVWADSCDPAADRGRRGVNALLRPKPFLQRADEETQHALECPIPQECYNTENGKLLEFVADSVQEMLKLHSPRFVHACARMHVFWRDSRSGEHPSCLQGSCSACGRRPRRGLFPSAHPVPPPLIPAQPRHRSGDRLLFQLWV